MQSDGKLQALNVAVREMIPHLVDIAHQNPHADVFMRAIAFSTGARWHMPVPTIVDDVRWTDLDASGYTDLGAALDLLTAELRTPPMPERALPPAIVLISDGMPTDAWEPALERLLREPWGARSVRMAVGLGRDVDQSVLRRFISDDSVEPLTANNPEQLVALLRWASVHAGRLASSLHDAGPPVPDIDALSETVW